MRALGHIDPHHVANLWCEHGTHLTFPLILSPWPDRSLTSRVRFPCPWALHPPSTEERVGAAVRPSTVHEREAGAGAFFGRSCRKGAAGTVPCLTIGRACRASLSRPQYTRGLMGQRAATTPSPLAARAALRR